MHPILFHLGDVAVHSYGAAGAVGFLLVAGVALVRARALGIKPERTADLIFWTSVAALLGARALYLLQNPQHVDGPLSFVDLRSGGLVFYGAMIVGLPVGSLLMRAYSMPFYAMWDIFATAMPLAHAISRLGCFAAGCCWGAATDVPWAVTYTHPRAVAPLHQAVHPTQLYEAGWLLLVGVVVNAFYARKRFDGQVMLLYLTLYAFGRSVVEAFRGDAARGFFLPGLLGDALTFSQGTSLVLAAVACAVFLVGARRARARSVG